MESFGYSHSPKKGSGFKHARKESDLFFEQTRRNSLLSNFGGGLSGGGGLGGGSGGSN